MNLLPTDFIQFLWGLFVNNLVSSGFWLFLFQILGDLQSVLVQIVVLLPVVVFDSVRVKLRQLLTLLDERQLPSFSSVYILIGFIDCFTANLRFHQVLSMWNLILICVLCDNEVDLLWRQEGWKLFNFRNGSQFFYDPNQTFLPNIITQRQTILEDFGFSSVNLLEQFSEWFYLPLFFL